MKGEVTLLAFLIITTISNLFAQNQELSTNNVNQDTTTSKIKKIVLNDGTELIGYIIQQDQNLIIIKTINDILMTIPTNQVKKIEEVPKQFEQTNYTKSDPNKMRLFFAPTARPIEAGKAYFSIYQIFFPSFGVGIANVISIAGGVSLFPGLKWQFIYLMPKITLINRRYLSLAGEIFIIGATRELSEVFGIFHGVATFGTENLSLTIGFGRGYLRDKISDKSLFFIGGEAQITNSLKLLTENWLIPDSKDLLFFGARFFSRNLAADFGLIYTYPFEAEGFPLFPWIGFTYSFSLFKQNTSPLR